MFYCKPGGFGGDRQDRGGYGSGDRDGGRPSYGSDREFFLVYGRSVPS